VEWTRVQRGWYEATDAGGIRWRIVQEGSQKWQPRRSIGLSYEEFGRPWESLADAKWYCERESAEWIARFPEDVTIEASDPRYRSKDLAR
jgi:hypothetical protein